MTDSHQHTTGSTKEKLCLYSSKCSQPFFLTQSKLTGEDNMPFHNIASMLSKEQLNEHGMTILKSTADNTLTEEQK